MERTLIQAETWHDAALGVLRYVERNIWLMRFFPWRRYTDPALEQKIWGLHFSNPVGLAAGWDKSAKAPRALSALGFGFLEFGTVTLWPEPGWPRPRLWRDFKQQWIVNRIGFANDGALIVGSRLRRARAANTFDLPPIAVSLGKMPASAPEDLVREIKEIIKEFYSAADLFVLNISSPNTPKGFQMGLPAYLAEVLPEIQRYNIQYADRIGMARKPMLIKMAPSHSRDEIEKAAAVILEAGLDGVVAVNSMPTPRGGLSGLPLRAMALKNAARWHLALGGKIPLVAVGGILSPEDAWQRILAGAFLIEIFSGFVFRGPGLIRAILRRMSSGLEREGAKTLSEVRGKDAAKLAI